MAGSDDEELDVDPYVISKSKKNPSKSSDFDLSSSDSESSAEKLDEDARQQSSINPRYGPVSLETDFANILNLQKQLQNQQRLLDKEHSSRISLENTRQSLENDKDMLQTKIDALNKDKRALETTKIELEAKLRSLQLMLTEESERRKNTEVMFQKLKDQQSKYEEQFKMETENRQKLEMTVRSLQQQLQSLQQNFDQLELEKNEMQQQMNSGNFAVSLIDRQGVELEKERTCPNCSMGPADDDRSSQSDSVKTSQSFVDRLTNDLECTKNALKEEKMLSSQKIEELTNEKEVLQQKLVLLKNDLKLDEDTMEQTLTQYNIELKSLENENEKLKTIIADQNQLEQELNNLKSQLKEKEDEVEAARKQTAEIHSSTEHDAKQLRLQMEEQSRHLQDLKDDFECQSQKLMAAEMKLKETEKDLKTANALVAEKADRLDSIHSELQNEKSNHDTLSCDFQKTKMENVKLETEVDLLKNKTAILQEELEKTKQSFELERRKLRESEELNTSVTGVKANQDKVLNDLQSKNLNLLETIEDLKDKLELEDHQKSSLEVSLKDSQAKLEETQQMLMSTKLTMETFDKMKTEFQSEREQLKVRANRLTNDLEEAKTSKSLADDEIQELNFKLQKTAKDLADCSLLLQAKQNELEEAQQQLKTNNSRLKDVFVHEQAQEAVRVSFQLSDMDSHDNKDSRTDTVYSSDDRTSPDRKRHRKKAGLVQERNGSKSTSENSAIEKQITSLRTQLHLATKQLKAMEGKAYSSSSKKQSSAGYGSPSEGREHIMKKTMNLINQMHQIQKDKSAPQSHTTQVLNQSVNLADIRAEIEAKIRIELNQKLMAINEYLREHADTFDQMNKIRDKNESMIRKEFTDMEKELQRELSEIREKQDLVESIKVLQSHQEDNHRVRDIESIHNNFRLNQDHTSAIPPFSTNGNRSEPFQFKPTLDNLPFNLQQELNRSIAKHLEKAPQLDLIASHLTPGLAVMATYSKSAEDYMSILQRNYLIK